MDKYRLLTRLTGRRLIAKGSAGKPVLYLTFDDGPHHVHTPRLLQLMAAHSVKGTFFLVGRETVGQGELVSRMFEMGHELGNHSLSHLRMDRLSDRACRHEISGMNELLSLHDGNRAHIFRPPYGGTSLRLLRHCLTRGTRVALWSRDSMDYKGDSAAVIAGFKARDVQNGDVLLFHDDGAASCEALEVLLPEWLQRGFQFRTLHDLN